MRGGGLMGQIEVYEWLKIRRLTGDHNFFSVLEIKNGMAESGMCSLARQGVAVSVMKLESDGKLDVDVVGNYRNFRRVVRLKNKYVKGFIHG